MHLNGKYQEEKRFDSFREKKNGNKGKLMLRSFRMKTIERKVDAFNWKILETKEI